MNQKINFRYRNSSNPLFCYLLFGSIFLFTVMHPLPAAIVQTGNVVPQGAWSSSNDGYVGQTSDGSIWVDAGSQLQSHDAYIGYDSGVSGTAMVTGTGSKWTNNGYLYVGLAGAGTLTVADGGEVTTPTLYASVESLMGIGKITATKGALLDADFRFDATHPTQAILAFGSGGTLTVTAGGGILGAGYKENGSVTVAEGATITGSGYLGYYAGSSGTATVTGVGSKWTGNFIIGNYGSGTLRLEAGAQLTGSGHLGLYAGSSGTATITGAGSNWTSYSDMNVGDSGSGMLCIEAGGQVITRDCCLGYHAGASGTVTITGANTKLTCINTLFVGREGQGTLLVANGGEVTTSTLYASLGVSWEMERSRQQMVRSWMPISTLMRLM